MIQRVAENHRPEALEVLLRVEGVEGREPSHVEHGVSVGRIPHGLQDLQDGEGRAHDVQLLRGVGHVDALDVRYPRHGDTGRELDLERSCGVVHGIGLLLRVADEHQEFGIVIFRRVHVVSEAVSQVQRRRGERQGIVRDHGDVLIGDRVESGHGDIDERSGQHAVPAYEIVGQVRQGVCLHQPGYVQHEVPGTGGIAPGGVHVRY